MPLFQIDLRRTVFELHEVEADNEKEAIAALNEREDTLLHEEEENSEVLAVKRCANRPNEEERP